MTSGWYNYKNMYRRPSKRTELIKRIAVYSGMTALVLLIVSGLVFIILGYRFDADNGRVEQGALLQFNTMPTGATVEIDGKAISAKTTTKSSVLAGSHSFLMWKDGYENWQKTLDVKAGTLTWLDYARLIPKNRPIQALNTLPTLFASTAAPDGKSILLQPDMAIPSFQFIDIRSDDIKSSTLSIPVSLYTDAATAGVVHSFAISSWDTGGRFALIQHTYNDKKEWLVLDTKDVNATKNITTLLDLDIVSIVFSGTSGNVFYALSGGDIRKLDISAGTISRSLVNNVNSFSLFETNVITYVGTSAAEPTKRVVGLYREGDASSHILRTVTLPADVPLRVATARYFNQDYVAISEGSVVDITSGNYPDSASDDAASLATFASFTTAYPIDQLSFSPSGDYVLVQNGTQFTSFDVEHQRVATSVVTTDAAATVAPLKWLDDDHVWSDTSNSLTLREFDGANTAAINTVTPGHMVVISQNDKYLYSIGLAATGYQLQRVRMILP
jgi:PEGA domain